MVLPVYDVDGKLAGVKARLVRQATGTDKAVSPAGQSARGLVLADVNGRGVLAVGARDVHTVWIVEGETDFLTLALVDLPALEAGRLKPRARHDGVAVLGVYAGAWRDSDEGRALAARVPLGARVVVATDADNTGDSYATDVATTLQRRGFVVERRKPPPGAGKDWNEFLSATVRRIAKGA